MNEQSVSYFSTGSAIFKRKNSLMRKKIASVKFLPGYYRGNEMDKRIFLSLMYYSSMKDFISKKPFSLQIQWITLYPITGALEPMFIGLFV